MTLTLGAGILMLSATLPAAASRIGSSIVAAISDISTPIAGTNVPLDCSPAMTAAACSGACAVSIR